MRETLCASTFAAQIDPVQAVSALGEAPTPTSPTRRPLAGSRIPTEFAVTAAAVAVVGPEAPRVATMIAATAAATRSAAAITAGRSRRRDPVDPVRSGGNLDDRPSATS